MESILDKYVPLVREGMSREMIESHIIKDGLSLDDILAFWQAVSHQALVDAAALHVTNDASTAEMDAIWHRLQPFQFFQEDFSLPSIKSQPKPPGTLRRSIFMRKPCGPQDHHHHPPPPPYHHHHDHHYMIITS